MFSEGIPLIIYVLATIEGFVWTVGFDSKAELFLGGMVWISKWHREELVIGVGVFRQGLRNQSAS